MSDEQRVRTMAGWIGVEISKSRMRTPGKAGYGLWRVRSAAERHWHVPHPKIGPDGEWTDYLFEIKAIETAIGVAISGGTHAGPQDLVLFHPNPKQARGDKPALVVPTRWTSAYRGQRDLGVPMMRDEALAAAQRKVDGLDDPADVLDGLAAMTVLERDLRGLERTDPAVGAASARLDETVREIVERSTVRSRQRAANAEFQAEHLRRRAFGLQARYAAKRARDSVQTDQSDL